MPDILGADNARGPPLPARPPRTWSGSAGSATRDTQILTQVSLASRFVTEGPHRTDGKKNLVFLAESLLPECDPGARLRRLHPEAPTQVGDEVLPLPEAVQSGELRGRVGQRLAIVGRGHHRQNVP